MEDTLAYTLTMYCTFTKMCRQYLCWKV